MFRVNRSFLFLLVSAAFFTNLSVSNTRENGKIEGSIKSNDGNLVPGATIAIVRSGSTFYKVNSDSTGNFTIQNVAPGVYDAFVYKLGFKSTTVKKLQVKTNLTTLFTIILARDEKTNGYGKIYGKITAENRKPISNAKIIIGERIKPIGKEIFTVDDLEMLGQKFVTFTNTKGIYGIQVPAGEYRALVSRTGYNPFLHFSVFVQSDSATIINVSLHPGMVGTIAGTVKDRTGEVLPGAKVMLPGTQFSAVTDTSGNFFIPAVNAVAHQLEITMPGFKPWHQQIRVEQNQTTRVAVILDVEKDELKSELDLLEARAYELRGAYFAVATEVERIHIKNQLRQLLMDIFTQKEQNYGNEINKMKKSIEEMEKIQAERSKNRDLIVDRRLKELLTVY